MSRGFSSTILENVLVLQISDKSTSMKQSLVRELFTGPIDIVGDLHGEMDALRSLMDRLEYDDKGFHPSGRRLVFVGDLTDRGPDSLAVVDFVQRLIQFDRAQCVLGNHDLNLLLGHRKYDNGWFYGEEFHDRDCNLVIQRLADEKDRERILAFLRTLPIALTRPDLRVVHACWDAAAIEKVGNATDASVLHNQLAEQIEESVVCNNLDEVERELAHQNQNPVKLLTSGPEVRAEQPFEASGKFRYLERQEWWTNYSDDTPCVFGHYSMDASVSRQLSSAICVDFGAYKRRQSALPYKLAALRVPEWQILCDDGTQIDISSP
jgi:hypothetical protein